MGVAVPKSRTSELAHAGRQALWLALLLALTAGAQNGPPNMQQQGAGPRMRSSIDQLENTNPILQERWLRGLNIERQNAIVSDTNKLLKLARELNTEISSSNSDSLTPAQLRKVAEIEKLAHSVKGKMSTSAQSTPEFALPSSL